MLAFFIYDGRQNDKCRRECCDARWFATFSVLVMFIVLHFFVLSTYMYCIYFRIFFNFAAVEFACMDLLLAVSYLCSILPVPLSYVKAKL